MPSGKPPDICGAVNPLTADVCGLYAPHDDLPHRVVRMRRRKRGEGVMEWNETHQWEKFNHRHLNVRPLRWSSLADIDARLAELAPHVSDEVKAATVELTERYKDALRKLAAR